MDLDFGNFYFFDLLDPKYLDFQVPRSPNSQISRFPDFQTPPAPPDLDELSDPNLTPSPNAPRDQIHRKGLCCDHRWMMVNEGKNKYESAQSDGLQAM